MLKRILSPLLALAMIGLPLSAAQDKKEADRLDNCGTVLKEILDIPDDIQEWLSDLLGVSLGLENIIGQALIEHFVTDDPLFELEDPYPILDKAPNPNNKQGQPPLPDLVPVKLPIRDLTVSNNDVELILEGNVG